MKGTDWATYELQKPVIFIVNTEGNDEESLIIYYYSGYLLERKCYCKSIGLERLPLVVICSASQRL